MRIFRDSDGRRWDATVGRESWGTQVVIFSSSDGGGVRTSVLEAESPLAAERELQEMEEEELRHRLRTARPWE